MPLKRFKVKLSVTMCSVCAGPLSSYPTAKLLSQLKVDQWFKFGHHLSLTDEELKSLKKSPHPTAATLLAAKVKNIDLKWNDVVKSLLHIGEYKLAETVCSQQGLSLASSPVSVQSFTNLFLLYCTSAWLPLLCSNKLIVTSLEATVDWEIFPHENILSSNFTEANFQHWPMIVMVISHS